MNDTPNNPNHDPHKPWMRIPKFKQHSVNMLAGLSAGDRHPDWEEYALDQIEFIQYLEAMLHSPSADR